jgi:hypothetical protein
MDAVKLTSAIVLALSLVAAGAASQDEGRRRRTIWQGVYTSQQADRGQLTMGARCATCHAVKEWTGDIFLRTWAGRPLLDLYDTIRLTMPIETPASLTRDEYADIIASIIRLNGAAAGKSALPSDPESLKLIAIVTKPDR